MNDDKFDRMFTGWFLLCAVLSIAWLAFLVWVITTLVRWVVTK